MLTEFDKLSRMVQRQQNVSEPLPPFYLKTLISLEESLNTAVSKEKEAKKKMNASNARALTAMKQKIKKTMKEYETDLKKYQEVCQFVSSYLICLNYALAPLRILRLSNETSSSRLLLRPRKRSHRNRRKARRLQTVMRRRRANLRPSEKVEKL